ncbi:hypothetical protein CHH53_03930 [Terribacillus sp. 7520-G]|nr:hypothetical protein CHH53_03930 [Terribacillus sp. 7520-G]
MDIKSLLQKLMIMVLNLLRDYQVIHSLKCKLNQLDILVEIIFSSRKSILFPEKTCMYTWLFFIKDGYLKYVQNW